MSKYVVNRKILDTEKSEWVDTWQRGHLGDLYYVRETLYRTPKGQYWLHCEGGAGTRYARRVDTNTWTGGECVRLLSREQALGWCEKHDCTYATLEKRFGDLLEEA